MDFFDRESACRGAIRRFSYLDDPMPVGQDLATLVRLVDRDSLHPEIGWTADWSQTTAGLEARLGRGIRGNAVLTLGQPSPGGPSDPRRRLKPTLDDVVQLHHRQDARGQRQDRPRGGGVR